jgi:hypothetical protein
MRIQMLVGTVLAVLWSVAWSAAQTAAPPSTCLILKRASVGVHIWEGTEFYYVQGTFPRGMSFRTRLGGRQVREIVKKGGKFVILEQDYTATDLERAQRACEA